MNIFPIVNSVKSVTVCSFLEGVLIIALYDTLKKAPPAPHQHFFFSRSRIKFSFTEGKISKNRNLSIQLYILNIFKKKYDRFQKFFPSLSCM